MSPFNALPDYMEGKDFGVIRVRSITRVGLLETQPEIVPL